MTADEVYREITVPNYKVNTKFIGNETGVINVHRCAAICGLVQFGGENCNFFKLINNITCMMGNFDRNDSAAMVDGADTIYLRKGGVPSERSQHEIGRVPYGLGRVSVLRAGVE